MSTTVPTFSVAIRGYRAQFVGDAIASVLSQTVGDLEVVVYDDAGDLDGIVAQFGDDRVRYERSRPGEAHSERLRSALTLCRGRFLGALDDDDTYEPTFLERALDAFASDERVGIAFANHFWRAGDEDERLERRCALPAGVHHDFLVELLRSWPVALSAALIRREAWDEGEREKPIPPGVWGDRFMWLRAAESGWAFAYIDEPLVTYRVHDAQMSASHAWMRDPGVRTHESFRFSDPVAERLRRSRLSTALVARAAHALSEGDARGARADLRRAAQLAPLRTPARRLMLQALATVPAAAPFAARLWRSRPRPHPLWRERVRARARRGAGEP